MNVMMLIEALSSVAIEHAERCDCVVCRAVNGDTDALAEVMVAMHDEESLAQRRGSVDP